MCLASIDVPRSSQQSLAVHPGTTGAAAVLVTASVVGPVVCQLPAAVGQLLLRVNNSGVAKRFGTMDLAL